MKFKLKCAEQMLHEERKSVVDLKLEAKRKSDASLAVIGNLQKQVQRLERTYVNHASSMAIFVLR